MGGAESNKFFAPPSGAGISQAANPVMPAQAMEPLTGPKLRNPNPAEPVNYAQQQGQSSASSGKSLGSIMGMNLWMGPDGKPMFGQTATQPYSGAPGWFSQIFSR